MNRAGGIRTAGFTLIELLFVLVILALLAALLFPAFAGAQDKARQAVCVSNMRQIGLAFRLYMEDYDQTFPINRTCVGQPLPNDTFCQEGMNVTGWVDMVSSYTHGNIFKCPLDPTPVIHPQTVGYRLSSDPDQRTNINRTSYAKNNNIGNVPPPAGYIVADAMTGNVSTTIMLMEWAPSQGGGANPLEQVGATYNLYRDVREQPPDGSEANANANTLIDGGDDPYQRGYVQWRIPSQQHRGGANYVFTDGHAKWLPPRMVIGQFGFGSQVEYGNTGAKPDFRL